MPNIEKYILDDEQLAVLNRSSAGYPMAGHDADSIGVALQIERKRMGLLQPNLMDVAVLLARYQHQHTEELVSSEPSQGDIELRAQVAEAKNYVSSSLWNGFALGNIAVREHWPYPMAGRMLYSDIPAAAVSDYQLADYEQVGRLIETLEEANLRLLTEKMLRPEQLYSAPISVAEHEQNDYLNRCLEIGAIVSYNLVGRALFGSVPRRMAVLMPATKFSAKKPPILPRRNPAGPLFVHNYLKSQGEGVRDPEEEYDLIVSD